MGADAGFNNTRPDDAGRDRDADPAAAMATLARDWISLWQSELTAMAADPETLEAWQAVLALWAGGMAAARQDRPPQAPNDRPPAADRHERPSHGAGSADAPRPQAAAAAPDARDAEIERLGRHVAALERRLAELEHGGRVAVDPKRRRPRRA